MSKLDYKPLIGSVTTFYDPGLFWFVFEDEIGARNLLSEKLNNVSQSYSRIMDPVEGEKVIIRYGEDWVRAEIADVKRSDLSKIEYVCWLIDYGIFVQATSIHKLPEDASLTPGFAHKAMLYGMQSITLQFDIGVQKLQEHSETDWVPGIRRYVIEILSRSDIIQSFNKKFKLDDFMIGNLYITDPQEGTFDINDKIIGLGFAKMDEAAFTSSLYLSKKEETPLRIVYSATKISAQKGCYKLIKTQKTSTGRGTFRSSHKPFTIRENYAKLEETDMDNYSKFMDFEDKMESTGIENIESNDSFVVKSTESGTKTDIEQKVSIGRGFSKMKSVTNEASDSFRKSPPIDKNSVEDLNGENTLLKNETHFAKVKNDFEECSDKKSSGRGFAVEKKNLVKFEQNENVKESIETTEKCSDKKSSGRGFAVEKKNLVKFEQNENVEESIETTEKISIGRGFAKLKKNPPKNDDKINHLTSVNLELKETFDLIEKKSVGRGFALANKIALKNQKSDDDEIDECFEDALETISNNTDSEQNNTPEFCSKLNKKIDILNIPNCKPAGADVSNNRKKSTKNYESDSSSSTSASSTNKSRSYNQNFQYTVNSKRPPDAEIESKLVETQSNDVSKNINDANTPKCEKLVTGRCKCSICESWNDNSKVFEKFEEEKLKPKKKTIVRPYPLFKTSEEEENTFEINTKREYLKDVDELAAPRLLVHGHFIPEPVSDLCCVPFNETVQHSLSNIKYESALTIQTYAWPAIMRGHHVFIVSTPDSGKTMSYVPAICTFALSTNPELPEIVGPITIVICPRVKVAETVFQLIDRVLGPRKQKKVCLAVPPFFRHQKIELASSVDILVCTPRTLIKILKEKLFSLKKLCHVVLECANDLFELFPIEMEALLSTFQKTLLKRIFNQSIQLITISQQWSKPLEGLAKKLKTVPLICIASNLEAALYGRADIQIQFIESDHKPMEVIKIVKDNMKILKTLVYCNTSKDVSQLLKYLSTHGVQYEFLNEESTMEDINSVKRLWANSVPGKYFVLLCTDHVFNTSLAIRDVSVAIQYSLPENWSQFSYRYFAFFDNYESPLIKSKKNLQRCKMHIFIDESNSVQFPRIVQFLKRMECNLNQKILDNYSNLMENMETEKINNGIKLCEKLLLFGSCNEINLCKNRHALSPKLDITNTLPQSGLVKLNVLYILSPISYYVRLIEHTDSEGKVHEISDHFAQIAAHMAEYTNEENRKPVLNVKIGGLYTTEESKDLYRRCEVLEVFEYGVLKRPVKVVVRLIDLGSKLIVPVLKLYLLSKHLRDIPPQAIPVNIVNIGPPDSDFSWSQRCVNMLLKEFKNSGYEHANCFFTGRIKLQLNNTLLLEDLELQESLDDGALLLYRLSVRDILLKFKLSEVRPDHLENLYKLCRTYNLNLPDYSLPVIKKIQKNAPQQKPNWAHLENLEKFNMVYFAAGHSPDLFFVKLCKNENLLDRLNKNIIEAMNKPFYPKIVAPEVGRCYLVQDPVDKTYARAIVTKICDNTAECFFVDYGDDIVVSVSELQFLSDDLITQLPFQAIECKLYGIEPAGKTWLSEATDIFYDICKEPGTNILRILHVQVMCDEKAELTGYKKYSVILLDTFEKDTIINNLFLDHGYAVQITENRIEVDFEELKPKTDYENSTDNEEEYINTKLEEIDENDLEKDTGEWDFQLYDPEEFFRAFARVPKENFNSTNTTKEKNSFYSDNKRRKALPPLGYSTPNVVWRQNESHVILHVQIPGVTNCSVQVLRSRLLSFKTICKETTYKLDLNLYAKVAQKVEDKIFGLYVLIKLKKQVEEEWPHLTLGTEKLRNIVYNVDNIEVEEDSDDEKMLSKEIIEKAKQCVDYGDENGPFIYEYGSDIDWAESDFDSDHDSDYS